jgi:LacI family transcriptional regulator
LRYTVVDVARDAGVSVATVDRVLNQRAGVRERTRQIVYESARRLGYVAPSPAPQAGAAPVRLDFLLPSGENAFMRALSEEIAARAGPGLDVGVAHVDGFDPDAVAAALIAYRGRTQGLGLVAPDQPAVREAIRGLTASGVPVVTLVSDVHYAPRQAFVGIDNRAAGRLAGYILHRFVGAERPGQVAMFAGSLSFRAHEEREMGFRSVLAEEASNLRIVELREMRDDPERAYAEAGALLDAYPGLAAIYNIGGGNVGIARALKERGRAREVVFVGHEITAENRALLIDRTLDAAIDQNARAQAEQAAQALASAARGEPYAPRPPHPHVIFRENIPEG